MTGAKDEFDIVVEDIVINLSIILLDSNGQSPGGLQSVFQEISEDVHN